MIVYVSERSEVVCNIDLMPALISVGYIQNHLLVIAIAIVISRTRSRFSRFFPALAGPGFGLGSVWVWVLVFRA